MNHHAEGKKGTHHTDIIYRVETRGGGGGEYPETMLKGRTAEHQVHQGSTRMWTTEDRWLHRLTNASSKHALMQVHKQTQQNAREHRTLTDVQAQAPYKILLGTGESWRMHWRMCVTILQTLKGTQMLFVVT